MLTKIQIKDLHHLNYEKWILLQNINNFKDANNFVNEIQLKE
jgi:hypothetical protein